MKTAVLNATDQRDPLGQDGEDEPDRGHERGDDGTQIALFLIAS